MTPSTLTRLDRLELHFGGECPVCRGWNDIRFTTLDADTGQETGETRPDACPRCGKRVLSTLEIVGMSLDELP